MMQKVEGRTTEIIEGMKRLLYRGQTLELSKPERTKLKGDAMVVSELL